MKRRQFLTIPLIAGFAGKSLAQNDFMQEYTREAYDEALASGEPLLLDFAAKW